MGSISVRATVAETGALHNIIRRWEYIMQGVAPKR